MLEHLSTQKYIYNSSLRHGTSNILFLTETHKEVKTNCVEILSGHGTVDLSEVFSGKVF